MTDTKKVAVSEPHSSTEAINDQLSEDERRALTGMSYLGTVSKQVHFNEGTGPDFVTNRITFTVPSGTRKGIYRVTQWNFSFGPSSHYLERPLAHIGIKLSNVSFSGVDLVVDVKALLRSLSGDDPWEAYISLAVDCYG
jgi:hypothetical protein